jgi:hypothetical protein
MFGEARSEDGALDEMGRAEAVIWKNDINCLKQPGDVQRLRDAKLVAGLTLTGDSLLDEMDPSGVTSNEA